MDVCDVTHWLICGTWLIYIYIDVQNLSALHNNGCGCMCHDILICVKWLVDMCDMTHCDLTCPDMWHAESICYALQRLRMYVPWCIDMYDMTHLDQCSMTYLCVRRDSLIRVTSLIFMCNLTQLCVWYSHLCVWDTESSCYPLHWPWMHVTWPIDMCDMWHGYAWQELLMCVTWLIYMCDVTQIYMCDTRNLSAMQYDGHRCMWHDSLMCVRFDIDMCVVTPVCVWHDSFSGATWFLHMCDMTLSCVYAYKHIYIYIHMCIRLHVYICQYHRTCTQTHTQTHTHTHTYTYT